MSLRVFLHIGTPKTGTTFLQQVIWSQRDLAATQGVHLPMRTFNDQFWATLDVRERAGKPPHPPESVGAWNRLVTDARRHTGTVLVSHELFAAASAEQARKAVGWFGTDLEVHVVITARDYVRQITAEWQEHVKHRNAIGLEEFVTDVRTEAPERTGWFWLVQDYAGLVARWGVRLPPARVHVVTVPPESAPSDLLWERFAGLIGLDAASFDTHSSRTNTSLGMEQAELLRRINLALGDRLPFPGPYPAVAKDILAHQILADRPGRRLAMSPADVEFAVAESQDVAKRLAETGVDVVGSLDELVPDPDAAAQAASESAYDIPPDEILLDEGVAALADLLIEMSDRAEAQRHAEAEAAQRSPLLHALQQATEASPGLEKARGAYRKFLQR